MSEPALAFVNCPDQPGQPGAMHKMAYWTWGDAAAPHVIVCAHGLSRQGRDFDVFAKALLARGGAGVRVVCPDVVGRGQSDWLKDPAGYQIPNYAADMLVLLHALKPTTLDWVGTSMGGLIGIVLCGSPGLPLPVPVRRLVLNDIGPDISLPGVQRIAQYLGQAPRFATVDEAAQAMWAISTGFGPHTPEQWMAFSLPMVKPMHDGLGAYALHYDPAIAVPMRAVTQEAATAGEALLWQLYDNIKAKTLLLRGADSDLLSKTTALAMTQRGPKAQLVEFERVGHAPTLIANNQVETGAIFLFDA
jgi:pimeloyl-ACP methyl ester carboxylesterase